jgi:hypothetical protein
MEDLIAEFAECCGYNRVYFEGGLISKQIAVDNCETFARCGGYFAELGVDEYQRIMSEVFAPAIELPSDYAAQLVRGWELSDLRDRHRWTGELPPKPEPFEWPPCRPYKTPQSTIDAFHFVLQTGDQERISSWIRNHPDDAPSLIRLVEAA